MSTGDNMGSRLMRPYLAVVGLVLALAPAASAQVVTGVLINEIYPGGGSGAAGVSPDAADPVRGGRPFRLRTVLPPPRPPSPK